MTDAVSLELQRQCQGAMPAGEVRLGGTVITKAYCQSAKEIIDLEVRKSDIWVISFPRSGQYLNQNEYLNMDLCQIVLIAIQVSMRMTHAVSVGIQCFRYYCYYKTVC